jgi:hypothetical protein
MDCAITQELGLKIETKYKSEMEFGGSLYIPYRLTRVGRKNSRMTVSIATTFFDAEHQSRKIEFLIRTNETDDKHHGKFY